MKFGTTVCIFCPCISNANGREAKLIHHWENKQGHTEAY